MAVYPNNRYASASPYRQTGGSAIGFDGLQSAPSARRNRFTNAGWGRVTGGDIPSGLLPLVPGALAAYHSNSVVLAVATAALAAGRFIKGAAVATLVADAAPLQLRALCSGAATATLSLEAVAIAQLVLLVGASGAVCAVPAAMLNATVSLAILPAPIQLTLAAQLSATGWLSGSISPYTPLSPEALAAKVEDTLGPQLNDLNTKIANLFSLSAVF